MILLFCSLVISVTKITFNLQFQHCLLPKRSCQSDQDSPQMPHCEERCHGQLWWRIAAPTPSWRPSLPSPATPWLSSRTPSTGTCSSSLPASKSQHHLIHFVTNTENNSRSVLGWSATNNSIRIFYHQVGKWIDNLLYF